MEDRIIEIEKKIAFQEDTIDHLNQAIIDQQKHIRELESQIKRLEDLMSAEEFIKPQDEETPPPHY